MCVKPFVRGRSFRWASSRSSGWKMGRWSTTWSRGSGFLSQSVAHPQCTPCSATAGPTSHRAGLPSVHWSAPWGTQPSFVSVTWLFVMVNDRINSQVNPICVCVFVRYSQIHNMEKEVSAQQGRTRPFSTILEKQHMEPPAKVWKGNEKRLVGF